MKSHAKQTSDPTLDTLMRELSDTRFALSQAYARFNSTADINLVDACVFELNAIESRYNYLLRSIKEHGEKAALNPLSEDTAKWT